MKVATAKDWTLLSLPEKYTTIDLDLSYIKASRGKILNGLIPSEMEEKWFVYYDQGILYFHRAWTGNCIYRITCVDDGTRLRLVRADVNRDPEQYTLTNDDNEPSHIESLINDLFVWKPSGKLEFIRLIPAQRFTGLPAHAECPYAFYADVESLEGKTVAEAYRLVNGIDLPRDMGCKSSYGTPILTSYPSDVSDDWNSPISQLEIHENNKLRCEAFSLEALGETDFVVLRTPWSLPASDLDVFPATWRALAYIVSDSKRMSAVARPRWGMSPAEYASADLYALVREAHGKKKKDPLGLKKNKWDAGFFNLDDLPDGSDEKAYYDYLSADYALISRAFDLFGISCRCWHGCGCLGAPEKPIVRFFWLRNILPRYIKVSLMKGKDRIDPV